MEHYKSLISDEEVIRELVKESKRREGKLDVTSCRLKPNLNFFQRTVNSLISTNSRIDRNIDSFKAGYSGNGKVKKHINPSYKYSSVKKPLVDCYFDRQVVLGTKLNLLKKSRVRMGSVIEESKSKLDIKHSDLKKTRKNSIINSRTKEDVTNKLSSDSDDSVEIINSVQERLSDKDKKTSYILNKSENQDDIIVLSSSDSLSEVTQQNTVKVRTKKKRKKEQKPIRNKTLNSGRKFMKNIEKNSYKNKEERRKS